MTAFLQLLETEPVILGEGALIERLRRSSSFELDPFLVNSAFIYDLEKHKVIEMLYREYLDIGCGLDMPLLLSTPTWRASRENIARAGYADRDVNGDNFRFLDQVRGSYGEYGDKVGICGLMSCRDDAFNPAAALTIEESRAFHLWQAEQLSQSGIDFLLAATLPAFSEAAGLAQAIASTGIPYMISFVLRPEGTLLDGTPLGEAVERIDELTSPAPLAYMCNCTHASNFRAAMLQGMNASCRHRMIGLLANTSALSPEQLDEHCELQEEEPQSFATDVGTLHDQFGLKILGGCCGTDDRHIGALAKFLSLRLAGSSSC